MVTLSQYEGAVASSLSLGQSLLLIWPHLVGMIAIAMAGFAISYILSLTVVGSKSRCTPCIYWATAIFSIVSNYNNLFLPFAFFLDCSHFTFGYELVVCPETESFMKIIRDLFPPIQWDEPLFLYSGKIHRF